MLNSPRKNCILASLPESVLQEWAPFFEPIELPIGQVICEQGSTLNHIYFPTTSVISWVHMLENGATTQVSITGREGLVGLYQLMGTRQTTNIILPSNIAEGCTVANASIAAFVGSVCSNQTAYVIVTAIDIAMRITAVYLTIVIANQAAY